MIFLSNIRTDLAIEAAQICDSAYKIDGADIEQKKLGAVGVTSVCINTEAAAERIGKPMGEYVTIEAKELRGGDEKIYDDVRKILTDEITRLAHPKKNKNVLVVGLGNWNVTPDALGPKVIDGIMVTRHLFGEEELHIDEDVCSVCAVSPGVLGITGIETGEIIKGITQRAKPDVIIAIDALASRRMERVSTTIQISDSGIVPGSGVGNHRNAITLDTMGVPVVAIGVPTVVDAATVASDSIEMLTEAVRVNAGEKSHLFRALKSFDDDNRYTLIKEVLSPFVGDLIVTPKEVDDIIDDISAVISDSINAALLGYETEE